MKQTPQVRNRPSPGLTAAPIFAVALFSATPSQAADVTPLFQGEVAPITDPAPIRVRPNGGAFCVLHQRLISDEDDAPEAQIVTFDTGVEGTDAAAVVVQTVKGHRESAESPPIFGYQHRMTLDANMGDHEWSGETWLMDLWQKSKVRRKWRIVERTLSRPDTDEKMPDAIRSMQLWR